MTDNEITKALAEKVMGWIEEHNIGTFPYWKSEPGTWHARIDEWQPLYKDEFSCAVLDKMVETGWSYSISANPPWSSCLPGTLVEFNKGVHPPAFLKDREEYDFPSHIDNRRRAIAIAALKAVGAWEE